MSPLKIFCVGGTIDKIYFDAKSQYEVGAPNVEKILADFNIVIDYQVVSLMQKDSLDLTADDRQLIYDAVSRAEEKHIIITHGTDTMVETAQHLQPIDGKTIVLTGALEPAMFKTSDAVFNVGCAIGAVQSLAPGVYIAMNGRVFSGSNVRKNRDKNCFELVSVD